MRRILVLVVAAAVVVIAVAGIFFRKNGNASYVTAKVDRGSVVASVSATGTLSALVTVQVGSQVSGMVKGLFADFNSVVKKGQLVAQLDPALFEAQAGQARANLAAARANAERMKVAEAEAKRALARARELRDKELNSESDLDTTQAAYESAVSNVRASEAQAQQADAALTSSLVNLEHTSIYAPVDGIVISRNVDAGQTVAASLQAPTIFTIAGDLTRMQAHANVSEADVGRLSVGQDVTFTVDAFPERRFTGKLSQIRNSPTTIQNVVTYDGVIDVDNEDLALRPGMTATIRVEVARSEGVLRIPNTALRFKPPSAQGMPSGAGARPAQAQQGAERGYTVWILENGTLKPVQVKIGITDSTLTEIVSGGLAEGAEVVVEAAGGNSRSSTTTRPPGMGRPF